jgi:hypothetical protein
MAVHGRTSITEPGATAHVTDHNRLQIVSLLIKAEADPTSIVASYKGAHSSLVTALDRCESDVGRNDFYQVRLLVEGNVP